MTHLLQYNHATGRHDEVDIPGGGASELLTLEFTAEQVAEVWDDANVVAAIPIDDVSPGDLIQLIWEDDNSLDQGQQLNAAYFYSPGATSEDVSNLGSPVNGVIGGVEFPATYGYTVAYGDNYAVGKAGSQLYVVYAGDAAPTEGTSTLKILVAKA